MASDSPPPPGERLAGLLEPARLMTWAMSHYFCVCAEAVFQKGQILAPLTDTRRLRDESFGRFWVQFTTTPQQESSSSTTTHSEEENNNADKDNYKPNANIGSSDLIPPLLKTARGIVLDIGPGTGTQMPLLRSPAIKAIYGAEPCRGLHAELRAKAFSEGLGDKYHILPCGVAAQELIPALRATGTGVVDGGSPNKMTTKDEDVSCVFDTILCVRVLCSVPHMDRTTCELYRLLRPGGRLLVTEHVVNPWRQAKGSLLARVMQAVYQLLGWSWYMGDCHLDRDTETALRRAADEDGGWESVELERSFGWSALPYVSGTLVKKGEL